MAKQFQFKNHAAEACHGRCQRGWCRPNEEVYLQMNYPILMDTAAQQLGVFGPTEILCSYDTYQFSNYDRYDAATFSEAHKTEVRDTQFPIDLEKAYELGKRLVKKCKEE